MKKKIYLCVLFAILFFSPLVSEANDLVKNSKQKKEYMFPKSVLGGFVLHMKKITEPSGGNCPAIEFELNSNFKWKPCKALANWGKKDETYKYFEEVIPGTRIIFNITNKLDDVTYYKVSSVHPYNIPAYNEPDEAEFLKRFIFFKFTATAAKGLSFFERKLDNDLYALDTESMLLYAYSVPADYERMIGNNYIPLKWEAFELSEKTKRSGIKFYEYDPIGFVSRDSSFEFHKVKTNIHLYDWWVKAMIAGRKTNQVKKLRYMPQVDANAEKDFSIRDAKIPVVSPYRKKDTLNKYSKNQN